MTSSAPKCPSDPTGTDYQIELLARAMECWCCPGTRKPQDPATGRKKYGPHFEPKLIAAAVLAKTREIGRAGDGRLSDIRRMVVLGVVRGDNLDAIESALNPESGRELRRLRRTYGLVSEARGCRSAVTLSRVCMSFPAHTCAYLHRFGPVAVNDRYPRAMATLAFAYLVPDRDAQWCTALRKAHMLYRYERFVRTSFGAASPPADVVRDVVHSTRVAVRGSHVGYDTQIVALKRFGLIARDQGRDASAFVATEEVRRAARAWDEKVCRLGELDKRFG